MAPPTGKLPFPNPAPWFGRDKVPGGFYRGIRMMTNTNLHAQLAAVITELVPPDPAGRRPRVLDLGCGEGALSQRLCDLGYEVVSVDVDAGQFKAQGPRFIACDFNDRAALEQLCQAAPGPFDLVVSSEVIEHLRSPWDFVAACRRLCEPHTHLVITMPNVASWWSRFWFLLTGDLWGFQQESWGDPGHINPIPVTEMKNLLRENGFECLRVIPGGLLPVIWLYNWKRVLVSLFMLPFRLVMRGTKDGWELCFHAKRIA